MRDAANDVLLSLLCGLALLIVTRAAYGVSVGWLPDAHWLPAYDPLAALALSRLVLFALLTTAVALPLMRVLAHHARRRDLTTAIPGASCAAALFLLLEWSAPDHPFPRWFDIVRAALLFALPLFLTQIWWRSKA